MFKEGIREHVFSKLYFYYFTPKENAFFFCFFFVLFFCFCFFISASIDIWVYNLGKIFSGRHFFFFLIFPRKQVLIFHANSLHLQIVSSGDDSHEIQNLFSGENKNKNIINLSPAELAQRLVKFNSAILATSKLLLVELLN